MSSRNFNSRTVWIGDCLGIMRGMNSESVDLIYLDPPLATNTNRASPVRGKTKEVPFGDTWALSNLNTEWIDFIEAKHPALYHILLLPETSSHKIYLAYMSERLYEMRRLLRATGSICLHCDSAVSHYLRLIMDAVFGQKQFKNEIVWCYRGGGSAKRKFPKRHDVLLLYGKNSGRTSHYVVREISSRSIDVYDGMVNRPVGRVVPDWWEIPPLSSAKKERVGYPGQKPLALLERIILATSGAGDMVFDPFCGCATALVAAEALQREWVGIDTDPKAMDLVTQRIYEQQCSSQCDIEYRDDIPQRTDIRRLPKYDGKRNRECLLGEQEGNCAGCGRHFTPRQLEPVHIIPRSHGGTDHVDNLQLLCASCRRGKSMRETDEGRRGLEERLSYLGSKLRLDAQLGLKSTSEKGSTLEMPDEEMETVLHGAVVAGEREIVEILLDADANPNTRDSEGLSPLALAVMFGESKIMEILLKAGADPNMPEVGGRTPLHLAGLEKAKGKTVKSLLDAGADPNIQDITGATPLHIAVQHKKSEIAKVLLRAEADPNIKDEEDRTPLHIAVVLSEPGVVQMLLNAGADPRARVGRGMTPLHLAAEPDRGKPEIIKSLVEAGADPNEKNRRGKMPLHIAMKSESDKQGIVKVLLDVGATPV